MLQKIVLNFCENIVLAIEKNCEGWQPRICKHFEIPRTNYSNRQRSKQFLNEAWKKSLAHHLLIKCCLNLKFDNWILLQCKTNKLSTNFICQNKTNLILTANHLKALLFSNDQKRIRGARKTNLFTILVEIWCYDSRNLCSKKGSFSEHLYGWC